jgi:outer membrane protein assembly factor BamB
LRWVIVFAVIAVLGLSLGDVGYHVGLGAAASLGGLAGLAPMIIAVISWAWTRSSGRRLVEEREEALRALAEYLRPIAPAGAAASDVKNPQHHTPRWSAEATGAYLSGKVLPPWDFVADVLKESTSKNRWPVTGSKMEAGRRWEAADAADRRKQRSDRGLRRDAALVAGLTAVVLSVTAGILIDSGGPAPASWTRQTGGPVMPGVAVADGTVYAASNDEYLYALDAATGERRWRQYTGAHADSSPSVAGGVVYIGSWFKHRVYALDAVTGKIRWTSPTGSSIDSSPTVADGIVYIGSDDHDMYALDASNGRRIWKRYVGGEVESRPAVSGGMVYVGSWTSSGGNMCALTVANGDLNWCRSIGPVLHSGPAVVGETVYVGSDNGKVYALNAINGQVLWKCPTGGPVDSSPVVADGTVYVGSDDGRLHAINATTGKPRWLYPTGEYVTDSPAVAYGTVYFGSYNRKVYAVSAASGQFRWMLLTGGHVESSPVVAGGTVYIGSDDGKVYAIASTGADGAR